MANHPQALKRQRQSEKAHQRNKHYKSMIRTAVKKALAASGKEVTQAYREAESLIQRVAGKGVIPKKRASRKVARLARKLKQTS